MMNKKICMAMLCGMVSVATVQGYSNPIEGGSTEVVTNAYQAQLPWYMVGGNSEGNSLVVTDGGSVDNQIGYIGNNISSSNNSATVTGTGSVWNSSMELSVGNMGFGNTLTVADGGRVDTANGYVGNNSGNNAATVDGSGSLLNATTLHVGHLGSDNSLTVSDGGRVETTEGTIGYWIGADNNTVTVQGAGSVLDSSSAINVGDYGSGNQLVIDAEGRVESPVVNLGVQTISSNNTITVTGSDSMFDAPEIHIGGSAAGAGGTGNLVEVENGGTVATTDLNIYAGNQFDLNNGGTLAVNTNFNASMSGFNFNSGGTLEVGGELTGMGSEIEDQRTVVMNGSNAVWNKTGASLYVGRLSASNQLVITDGAYVGGRIGYIGASASAVNNMVEVNGSNSLWELSSGVHVGAESSGNAMIIQDGGHVATGERVFVNSIGEGGANNLVIVRGSGSGWVMQGDLGIGELSVGNQLEIKNGALVENDDAFIGFRLGSSNNVVRVGGAGSLWKVRSDLAIGQYDATNNGLVIENGGHVQSRSGVIGYFADGNSVVVQGAGSSWSNFWDVYVGRGGSSNSLVIADGGYVFNDEGYIGGTASSHEGSDENSVVVMGSNSLWHSQGRLYVGEAGNRNTLHVDAGGRVESTHATVGYFGSSDNSVVVAGDGSRWNNAGSLIMGDSSRGNQMLISDGGSVANTIGLVGYRANAIGNLVQVTGSGSRWVNTTDLHVGYFGSSNRLTVADAGHVESRIGHIGSHEGANGNLSVISGNDSIWQNNEALYLGGHRDGGSWVDGGTGNSLTVSNDGWVQVGNIGTNNIPDHGTLGVVSVGGIGGAEMIIANGSRVENDLGYVGIDPTMSGSVTVTGAGSVWSNSVALFVGEGSDSSVSILAGGRVDSGMGLIGLTGDSSNNLVVVSGEDSVWDNFGELHVGYSGYGNTVQIEDGALVSNYSGIIGETSKAWSNEVSVVGAGSEWRNAGNLYLGGQALGYTRVVDGVDFWISDWVEGGRGNSLYVADDGLVSVGHDMHNRNYSTVDIETGGHMAISSNYYQDATSVLRFGVETNVAGTPLNPFVSVGGTAEFEAGATLQYHSNVGVLDFDTFHTNLIVEANQLIIAGITNANAVDLQALNLDGSLVEVMLWEQDQDIYGLVGRRHLADSAGFAPDTEMALLSKEIDDLSLLGNSIAVGHINLLNGMSSAQQNAQLTQRYTQGTPTYRHRQGVLGGQKQVMAQTRAFQSASHSRAAKPEGAAGPHKAEQELRGWMRGYGSWASHDGTPRSFSGFDQNVYGTVVGLDKAYGNVLLGAAGGYARSDLTQDNNDSSDAKTGFGVLYSSFGSVDWFGDLNLSYGRSAIQTHSGTALGGEGDFDADNFAIYLGGGKEVRPEESSLLFTPEAALTIGYYGQESYNDGLMDVDAYDRWSFQSRIGAALAVETQAGSVMLKPEARVYWLHEFNADPDQIGYSLIGGGGNYTFGIQAPDEDIFEVGVGFSATFSDRLELALDVDAQQSGLYHAVTVGARARYEF